jgi:hypothetical protein
MYFQVECWCCKFPTFSNEPVTRTQSEMCLQEGDEEKIKHRIPHRFETLTNIGANWCCHCGYMLPLGRKNSKKCSECGITCHATCTHFVPDFCGMSMETANRLIADMRLINSTRSKQKPATIKQVTPQSGGRQSTTGYEGYYQPEQSTPVPPGMGMSPPGGQLELTGGYSQYPQGAPPRQQAQSPTNVYSGDPRYQQPGSLPGGPQAGYPGGPPVVPPRPSSGGPSSPQQQGRMSIPQHPQDQQYVPTQPPRHGASSSYDQAAGGYSVRTQILSYH